MPIPPAPWDVLLGRIADGSVVVVPGPAGPKGDTGAVGPPGADGAQGPEGPVAAPLAKYMLDEADAGLVNGIVVHRGLGPDRVPASPAAEDDEMITAVTGYDGALWTPFNAGSSTFNFDEVGGLRIDVADSDAALRSIEQPLDAGPWQYTMKVANGAPYPGATSNKEFVGLSFRNTSNGRWDLLYTARRSQINQVLRSKVNADSSFVSDTFETWPDPTTWYYLRVTGTASTVKFEVSTNGLTFIEIETTGLYCAVADRIGIFFMCNESVNWSAFVQWFRRTG